MRDISRRPGPITWVDWVIAGALTVAFFIMLYWWEAPYIGWPF